VLTSGRIWAVREEEAETMAKAFLLCQKERETERGTTLLW
jgi:streptomycin 6-kinase